MSTRTLVVTSCDWCGVDDSAQLEVLERSWQLEGQRRPRALDVCAGCWPQLTVAQLLEARGRRPRAAAAG